MLKKLVILVSGKMQSGKNQLSQFIKDELEVQNVVVSEDMFAKGVKDGCRDDFKDLAVVLNKLAKDYGIEELKISDENWYEKKTPITRAILQIYGTQIFRERVADSWWVDKLRERILASSAEVILITDVRFPNEIEGIYPKNGEYDFVSIRLNRDFSDKELGPEHQHLSETALDDFDQFHYIVENNGTLNELRQTAQTIVNEIEQTRQSNVVEKILI